jgi:hypothetical protein
VLGGGGEMGVGGLRVCCGWCGTVCVSLGGAGQGEGHWAVRQWTCGGVSSYAIACGLVRVTADIVVCVSPLWQWLPPLLLLLHHYACRSVGVP